MKRLLAGLVATVKGSRDGFIVVRAHYDKASQGCGAADNLTGIESRAAPTDAEVNEALQAMRLVTQTN